MNIYHYVFNFQNSFLTSIMSSVVFNGAVAIDLALQADGSTATAANGCYFYKFDLNAIPGFAARRGIYLSSIIQSLSVTAVPAASDSFDLCVAIVPTSFEITDASKRTITNACVLQGSFFAGVRATTTTTTDLRFDLDFPDAISGELNGATPPLHNGAFLVAIKHDSTAAGGVLRFVLKASVACSGVGYFLPF
jgi:hypothetical protein